MRKVPLDPVNKWNKTIYSMPEYGGWKKESEKLAKKTALFEHSLEPFTGQEALLLDLQRGTTPSEKIPTKYARRESGTGYNITEGKKYFWARILLGDYEGISRKGNDVLFVVDACKDLKFKSHESGGGERAVKKIERGGENPLSVESYKDIIPAGSDGKDGAILLNHPVHNYQFKYAHDRLFEEGVLLKVDPPEGKINDPYNLTGMNNRVANPQPHTLIIGDAVNERMKKYFKDHLSMEFDKLGVKSASGTTHNVNAVKRFFDGVLYILPEVQFHIFEDVLGKYAEGKLKSSQAKFEPSEFQERLNVLRERKEEILTDALKKRL